MNAAWNSDLIVDTCVCSACSHWSGINIHPAHEWSMSTIKGGDDYCDQMRPVDMQAWHLCDDVAKATVIMQEWQKQMNYGWSSNISPL